MKDPVIQLSVFELSHIIGEGGMGDVWRAKHTTQGVEVAIKVLREREKLRPKLRQAFAREVQSVARMLHPGITRIFDFGEINDHASGQSNGSLKEGAPYIAMELATRGSLSQVEGIFTWTQLRWLLTSVLDALAHAHARDVIHRDLKPDNILLTQGEFGHTEVKLTDFGLVHVLDPEASRRTADLQTLYAGTPAYMSPEQLAGHWRDFGPWTDLYALGCVAYELASGRRPFEGVNVLDIAHQQMTNYPAPLLPMMHVPHGFHQWVARLLAKRPKARFQRAADAAWALNQLPHPDYPDTSTAPVRLRTLEHVPPRGEETEPTLDSIDMELEQRPHITHGTLHTGLLDALAGVDSEALVGPHNVEPRLYDDPPPFPTSWVRKNVYDSTQLMGAGLALYGLREISLVGRARERDEIWSTLRYAFGESVPTAVILSGATGVGKTKLATWTAERLHELGCATVLRASHSPETTGTRPLIRMLARYLNISGLTRKRAFSRITRYLEMRKSSHATQDDPLDPLSLTELLYPGGGEDEAEHLPMPGEAQEPRAQINTPRDRYAIIARLLRLMCEERPVMILLDDVHWSLDSLEIALLLLTEEETADLPLSVVLTTERDAQETPPSTHRIIARIERMARSKRLAPRQHRGGLGSPPLPRLVSRRHHSLPFSSHDGSELLWLRHDTRVRTRASWRHPRCASVPPSVADRCRLGALELLAISLSSASPLLSSSPKKGEVASRRSRLGRRAPLCPCVWRCALCLGNGGDLDTGLTTDRRYRPFRRTPMLHRCLWGDDCVKSPRSHPHAPCALSSLCPFFDERRLLRLLSLFSPPLFCRLCSGDRE